MMDIPSGHGKDLFEIMKDKKMVNGISGDSSEIYNGVGCLAFNLLACLKAGRDEIGCAGNFYVFPVESKNCGEEYTYYIYIKENKIHMKVQNWDNILFDDDINNFGDFISSKD